MTAHPLPIQTRPDHAAPHGMVAPRSRAMLATIELVDRACETSATVLLTGETGTGKEVLARAIHAGSSRSDGEFIAINCAAFPDTLLESELFGHVRGAFTGADRKKDGLFTVADGGTLFLDEIGETSLPFQAKLLRVLQEREVRPVGAERAQRIDVRVVAATNRDLRHEIEAKAFRADLFYRLAVFPIAVPPLRERRDDILPLAEHFLRVHGARDRRPRCTLSDGAARQLVMHAWPGNVRELENEMQRAIALAGDSAEIAPELLSEFTTTLAIPTDELERPGESLRDVLERVEAYLIRRSLDQHAGHRAETARTLGLTREGLYKKMKRLGIA